MKQRENQYKIKKICLYKNLKFWYRMISCLIGKLILKINKFNTWKNQNKLKKPKKLKNKINQNH